MATYSRMRCASVLFSLIAAGCSGASPAAPVIRDLTVDPSIVRAAKLGDLTSLPSVVGTLAYDDDDGDVSELEATIEADGVAPSTSRIALKTPSNAQRGTLTFSLTLVTFAARRMTVKVAVYDRAQHRSNELTAVVDATAP
jgi:hypothetical protein